MLGPSIDKRDENEDALVVVESVSFIANREVLDEYGENFELRFEEGRLLVNRIGEEHHGYQCSLS